METALSGDPLKLRFAPWFAGAISELRFRDKNYVNAADHGRLIQAAVSFDGWGECLNPTEAGSVADGRQRKTTSVLLASQVKGSIAEFRTRMAYWMPPGASHQVNLKDLKVRSSPQPCRSDGTSQHVTSARNHTALSDIVMEKRIEVRRPNILHFQVKFILPRPYKHAMFEALTVYLEPEFDRFYAFEPRDGALIAVKPQLGGWRPLVVSTQDEKHALGMAAPDGPMMHAAFRWDDTSKLNCFIPKANVVAGKHRYACAVAIGTLEEVRSALVHLSAKPD